MEDIALLGIFSEYMVNMMTLTPGMIFFRIEAASTPFMRVQMSRQKYFAFHSQRTKTINK
jgi:hypothetical protein